MKRFCFSLFLFIGLGQCANATTYQWQSIRFEHGDMWSILTDRTVKGARVIHLSHDISDSYPVSILLSFVPKASYYAEKFQLNDSISANVMAANFSWPFIQRFSKESTLENRLISFNEVLVGKSLCPGAVVTVPTPQERIYISAQTFYVDKPNYYVLGSIVTRIDKGVMRYSKDYGNRIDRAYQLLKTVSVDFD